MEGEEEKMFASIRQDCMVEGWNSYNCHAVTEEAISAAEKFVRSIWIVPKGDGGVMVSWLDESLSVEFDDVGELESVYVHLKDIKTALDGK